MVVEMSKKELKLWIIVSNEKLSSSENLKDAVSLFENLAEFVVSDDKIMELKFDPGKNTFTVEEVTLKEIAKSMMEAKK